MPTSRLLLLSSVLACSGAESLATDASGSSGADDTTEATDLGDASDSSAAADGQPDSAGADGLTQDGVALDLEEQDTASEDEVSELPDLPDPPATLGGDRPAAYTLPANYDPAKAWPVVLLLHGYSASGYIQDAYLGISARATEDGVIVIVPDGTKNPEGLQFWNATDACCNFYGSDVDDAAYLTALVAEAKTYFNVDPKRVYAMGHSNGGFMSYRLACDHPEVFAGVVVLAGAMWLDPAQCPGETAVSVLQIHGTQDDTIGYEGDPVRGYPSARDSARFWAERNGCDAEPTAGDPLDLDVGLTGAETLTERWPGCDAGSGVELWTIQDGSHIPGFGSAYAKETLAFLLSHPRL